ncbi:nuclear transport factor 2 family protein [Streptacidiphilus sp. PAMC 29251]
MDARLEDCAAIADLMTAWIHRDLSEWDQLRGLFHPGATVEITWFDGLATDFVAGSARAPPTCAPST